MVIVVAVMPGADAVRAALELALALGLVAPAPGLELVELELEVHAARPSAAVARTAMAGTRSRCDLFIECLLSCGIPEGQGGMGGRVVPPYGVSPGGRPPGETEHRTRVPGESCGQRRSRRGRGSSALRPGCPAGR